MLWSLETLRDYGLRAADGSIGRIKDLFFDDHAWTVRYVVVDTGGWLTGRKVLIAPAALGEPDTTQREFPVALTREQIENGPGIDSDKPVDRQQETALNEFYGWPLYWSTPGMAGLALPPGYLDGSLPTGEVPLETARLESEQGDPNLRSAAEVTGYTIGASDGSIGDVIDFLTDLDNWKIRWLAVDTGRWLPGRQVVLAPDWIRHFNWAESTVEVDLTREQVRNSPPFDPSLGLHREYENRLYEYYGRPYQK